MDELTRMFACRWSSDLKPNDRARSTVVNQVAFQVGCFKSGR
jgi:hypothetical protein